MTEGHGMIAAIARQLASREGEREFDMRLAGLVRDGRHDDAERLLAAALAPSPSLIAGICRGVRLSDVRFANWQNITLSGARPGTRITAIGLDYSYAVEQATRGDAQPASIEVAWYSDGAFPFSTASRAELLAESASPTPRWMGAFDDIGEGPTITGLERLHFAITRHPDRYRSGPLSDEPATPGFVDYKLATWWLALRWHQAVRRQLQLGTTPAVPILVGTNEFEPFFNAVYWPDAAARSQSAQGKGAKRSLSDEFPIADRRASKPGREDPKPDSGADAGADRRERSGRRIDPEDFAKLALAARLTGSVLKKWLK
jgi:hypothetical protein